ncbi:MAG: hypothetical protein GXO87_05850 [Chlorobi bacterium]|nr:hypothetical protein [Chlorobiota bacterium]
MKKIIVVFIVILTAQFSFAQENTLLSSGITSSGGFGGPVAKFTQLNDQSAFILGARGGWIVNHSFIIGGGMYGLVGNVSVDTKIGDIIYKDSDYLRFGYGGLELEYIFAPMSVVHVSVYTLLGVGGVSYRNYSENFNETGDNYNHHSMQNPVFVAEPAVNVEVNLTEFFRIDLGVSYRYVSQIDYQMINAENLRGVSGILTFKFGKF